VERLKIEALPDKKQVTILNLEDNTATTYDNVKRAALLAKIGSNTIVKYLDKNINYLDKYVFKTSLSYITPKLNEPFIVDKSIIESMVKDNKGSEDKLMSIVTIIDMENKTAESFKSFTEAASTIDMSIHTLKVNMDKNIIVKNIHNDKKYIFKSDFINGITTQFDVTVNLTDNQIKNLTSDSVEKFVGENKSIYTIINIQKGMIESVIGLENLKSRLDISKYQIYPIIDKNVIYDDIYMIRSESYVFSNMHTPGSDFTYLNYELLYALTNKSTHFKVNGKVKITIIDLQEKPLNLQVLRKQFIKVSMRVLLISIKIQIFKSRYIIRSGIIRVLIGIILLVITG
jgi:hypothetical protein